MSTKTRLWILIFAVAGLVFSGASSWVHYRLLTDPAYTSPCDINATFSCTQAYVSRFGSVAGVPVALAGLAWFGLVALIAAFARPSGEGNGRGAAGTYLFALSVVGLAAILYLGYASFFVLKTGCLLCIGTYVSVVGIFILSSSASSVGMAQLLKRLPSDLSALFAAPTTFLVAVLYLVAAGSAIAFFPREGGGSGTQAQAAAPAQDAVAAFAQAWAQQPRLDLGIDAEGAAVLVVKFLDYQCPSCKAAYFAYKPVLDRFAESNPGAVKQVIKDFPLSNKCNFTMSGALHQAACEESAFVRMAGARGRAQEAIDWLFSVPDQVGLTPDAVKAEAARRFGVTDFEREYQTHLPDIQRDIADGQALQISSTPTYFINGVRAQTVQGWLPPEYFELAITLELERAGKQ